MKGQRLAALALAVVFVLAGDEDARAAHRVPPTARSVVADTTRVVGRHEPGPRVVVDSSPGVGHAVLVTTDLLPGSCCKVQHILGASSLSWRIGDRLDLRVILETCVDSAYIETTSPCDSFLVQTTLDDGELPVGMEWELLGLSAEEVAWWYDLAFTRNALDPRFEVCGADAKGTFHARLHVVRADTTGRARGGESRRRLASAVRAYREERFPAVITLLEGAAPGEPEEALRHILLAGAFDQADDCWAYAQESAWLAGHGLGCDDFSIEDAYAQCERGRRWRATQHP